MARSSVLDYLQSHRFWLFDLPSGGAVALKPVFGFSDITAPEMVTNLVENQEYNALGAAHVAEFTVATNMVLRRGVSWYDSDFWHWMVRMATGRGGSPRRTLVLIHFHNMKLPSDALTALSLVGMGAAGGAIGGGLAGAIGGAALAGLGTAFQELGIRSADFRTPARAWVLHGCKPSRYKPATDFSATDDSVSIQELEIGLEFWEEISLTG